MRHPFGLPPCLPYIAIFSDTLIFQGTGGDVTLTSSQSGGVGTSYSGGPVCVGHVMDKSVNA